MASHDWATCAAEPVHYSVRHTLVDTQTWGMGQPASGQLWDLIMGQKSLLGPLGLNFSLLHPRPTPDPPHPPPSLCFGALSLCTCSALLWGPCGAHVAPHSNSLSSFITHLHYIPISTHSRALGKPDHRDYLFSLALPNGMGSRDFFFSSSGAQMKTWD